MKPSVPITQTPTTESSSTKHGNTKMLKTSSPYGLCAADKLDTTERVGYERGEYLNSFLVQSQPPTSASDEQQPSNYGMTLLIIYHAMFSSVQDLNYVL